MINGLKYFKLIKILNKPNKYTYTDLHSTITRNHVGVSKYSRSRPLIANYKIGPLIIKARNLPIESCLDQVIYATKKQPLTVRTTTFYRGWLLI